MKITPRIMNWIARNNSLVVAGAVTFTMPERFMKALYANNADKSWFDGRACMTVSFDCDYPEDVEAIPPLLKMLDRWPFKTSFACVGHWIEKYPDEHKQIVDHGHEIINHTYSHPDNELLNPGRKFRYISKDEKREEIERCHEVCARVLGCEPSGCRIPHFKNLFTPEIYGILAELGYAYSSSTWLTNTTSFGMPFRADHGIIEFPLSTCPSHPFTVFDTWHSLNTPRLLHRIKHRGPESYMELFRTLLAMGRATGSYLNIYIDPLDVRKLSGFEAMLEMLVDDDIMVCTYDEYIKRAYRVIER